MIHFLSCRSLKSVLMATFSLLFLAVSPVHAQENHAQENISAAKRLPPGVLAYLRVTDCSQLKGQFLQTGIGHLWQDEALAPFKNQFVPQLEELSGKIQEETGATLGDLQNLVSGEFSLAFLRSREKGIGAVGMANVKSHIDLLQALLSKLDTQLEDSGAVKTSSTYAETEIVTFEFPVEKPNSKGLMFCYFVKDGYWAAGSSTGLLELILDRWDGSSSETFSADSNYNFVMQLCREQQASAPVVEWYLTPVELTLTGLSLNPETAMVGAFATGMLPALGLNKFKAYGGTLHLATEQHDYVSLAVICADTPANGVMNLFQFPADIKAPPAWVPASAASYTGLHWNLEAAYAGATQLVEAYLGPGSMERSVKQLANDPDGPGLNIKSDLIDQISGEIHFYSAIGEGEEPTAQFAVSIGIRDEAKISEVIQKILDQVGTDSEYRTEEVAGVTAYLPTEGSDINVAIAAKGQQLVVASDTDVLKSVLTGEISGTPLVNSADYQKTAAYLPPAASILSYSNFGQAMKVGYEAVRAGNVNALTEGQVDFSLLPPFESISKYLQPSGSYMVPTDRGALGVQFTPRYQP